MASDPPVMSFERFCAERGLTGDADVQGHIHAGLRSAPRTKTYERWNARRLRELQAARDAARAAYRAEIAAGSIREATEDERLRAAACGHEDNAATHAARRVMEKRAARRAAAERE